MNFSTRAAVPLHDRLHRLEVAGEQRTQPLGIERLAERGRPGQVAEHHRHRLALLVGGAAAGSAPHSGQNLNALSDSKPHDRHEGTQAVCHSMLCLQLGRNPYHSSMSEEAIVSEKGQVTIPKRLRDSMGIRPGQVLAFREERGQLVATKAVAVDPVASVYGTLQLDRPTDEVIAELRGTPDAV